MKLQPVRGTQDIIGDDYALFERVVTIARDISSRYGFKGIITPNFEFTDVFKRTLGDTSDIVTKEMYTFNMGDDSITLRPEFTAGICRAFISNGMHHQLPLKFFSSGPVFRHERPQKGRYRQFHQINLESIGSAEPTADIELIALASDMLEALGIRSRTTLELNSLGDDESRANYREALVAYFSRYQQELSDDSKMRLTKNPLRILDSKDENDKKIVAGAPILGDFYTENAKQFFNMVQQGLSAIGIAFHLNPKLVRGLDYYCHTAFEFTTTELGSQGTVLAGGRYDKLISMMGGPETPAVGCAGGVERLYELARTHLNLQQPRPIVIIPMGEAALSASWTLVHELRQKSGIVVELYPGNNLGKQLKKASKLNPSHAVIMGDQELAANQVVIKNLDQSQQSTVAFTAADILRAIQ
ncbi:MAG: histidine--tRNA ligase [Alphaproteobacteria bacterium]|nr:histidine--tRNA ligase [Alphaproteobacteria bacterium]